MGFQLERKRFNDDWRSIVLFLALVTIPTFWTLLDVQTSLGEAIGTSVASTAIGVIGWWFLRREGARADDVGLGRRAWINGLPLFVAWAE